jgi:hypothetical protein
MTPNPSIALAAVVLTLSFGTTTLRAQNLDARWLPWLGCWRAGTESEVPDLLVCVRPAGGTSGVEIATIDNGEVATTRTLVADGERHTFSEDNCSGWRSASFSADGRRIFLSSQVTCEGDVRTGSGIMAIASANEWLDAQSVGMGAERMPRASWYRAAPAPGADAPPGFELSVQRRERVADARVIAAAELSTEDVREAAELVDQEALVAFLIERNQAFRLDAEELASLADAGVPTEVIDVLVAVSYPGRFAIDRQAMRASIAPNPPVERRRAGYGDPFGWGRWGRWGRYGSYGACYSGLYWSFYCPWFYGSYGGYGYGWYDPYWYGGYGYWRPVVVVRDGVLDTGQGRAVAGRGYTRGGQSAGSSGRTAKPRSGSSQTSSSGSRSPSVSRGSSGGSGGHASPGGYSRGGGGGGSSSGGSGGTAKPRGR